MKWNEAEERGFTFTGTTWNRWDETKEKRYKEQAARIKATFKGADYRIVTDSANSWLGSNSKAIMGNDIYIKVQYFKPENYENKINSYEDRKLALQKEYETKLAELQKDYEKTKQEYEEILKLMKWGKKL